ncbi:MAG: hypothetical protein NXI16_09635 [Alphaproteobacteria bacterium]|nr:hypothetical protein [Alphaproteobacteria bacterium]
MPPTLFAPWDLPSQSKFNGRHPLLTSLLDGASAYSVHMEPESPRAEATERQAQALIGALATLGHGAAAAKDFVVGRDLASQARMMGPSGDDTLLFLHTAPMTLGQRPWILHIEELLTLFAPDVNHGYSMDVDIRGHPVFAFVKHLLEDDACRAVFTHLDHSHDWIGRLFQSDRIQEKTRFIPVGYALPEETAAKVDARWDSKRDGRDCHFLFTGSWNNHGGSFVQRGGMEVALAFAHLVRDYPDARLTMRTTLPPSIHEAFGGFLNAIPNLTWIEPAIDDEALFDLLLDADVFLLPAAGLHSLSLLRAMATGAVILTADAPGVEQFVRPDDTCHRVPLFQPDWSVWDPETGLLRQSYKVYEEGHNQAFITPLRDAMAALIDDPDRRMRLRRTARSDVLARFSLRQWRDGFADLVAKAIP